MIESLESRRFLSATVAMPYAAPNSVVSAALAIIDATPSEVIASANKNVGYDQGPSQAMLDVIEYHEGYSLSIYPDASGIPTVGIGIKLNSNNAAFASAALLAGGVSYSDLALDWVNIKSLWVSEHHRLSALRDTSPLWARFLAQNPSVASPVLTSAQASAIFTAAVNAKMAAVISQLDAPGGTEFYLLDRSPQIALVDLAYHVINVAKYGRLVREVQGPSNFQALPGFATDYISDARQISSAAAGTLRRARDDQALMRQGEDVTSLTNLSNTTLIADMSTTTLYANQTGSLQISAINAFGQGIIFPTGSVKLTESARRIVSMSYSAYTVTIHGLREGTTDITLRDSPASASITFEIIVEPNPTVTWQASGTKSDVDGSYLTTGQIGYAPGGGNPGDSFFLVDAATPDPKRKSKPLLFSLGAIVLDLLGTNYLSLGVLGTGGNYGLRLTLGSNEWDSGSAVITAFDGVHVAGTFSAGPDDSSGQRGSISGSFSGFISNSSAG